MEVTPKWSRAVPKFTKNTQAWWQLKTKWSEQEYINRRAAVIRKIRERWPDSNMLNGHGSKPRQEASDLLRPLVAAFDDSSWSDPSTSGQKFEKRLEMYTSWAFYLNRHFKLDESAPVTTLPTIPPYQPIQNDSKDSKVLPVTRVDPIRHEPEYWSETTSDEIVQRAESTTVEPLPKSEVKPQADTDWDDIEVQIDANALDLGTVWLPMIDLKPVLRGQPCHWEDFELHELYNQFSQETGLKVDPTKHEFVYLSRGTKFVFYKPGAYKVMLKRFSQAASGQHNVLRLLIQPRSSYNLTPSTHRTTPALRGKKFDVQQITPQSRAKSRFTGSETDYSSDSSQEMERPMKRLKHLSTESETVDETIDSTIDSTIPDSTEGTNSALDGWKAVNGAAQSDLRIEQEDRPTKSRPATSGFGEVIDLSLTSTQEQGNVKSEAQLTQETEY
ncbi:hypothetical protein OHC33_008438 [Knufia fluminis]|uniref:Uncharacterized protein n=1 Tax=Knufia fluminis TaxID=191047 RepID=A0AAN8I4X1_9EURO|nr:hypothetical protein OHC33_008438 [Knufia fluminis]